MKVFFNSNTGRKICITINSNGTNKVRLEWALTGELHYTKKQLSKAKQNSDSDSDYLSVIKRWIPIAFALRSKNSPKPKRNKTEKVALAKRRVQGVDFAKPYDEKQQNIASMVCNCVKLRFFNKINK